MGSAGDAEQCAGVYILCACCVRAACACLSQFEHNKHALTHHLCVRACVQQSVELTAGPAAFGCLESAIGCRFVAPMSRSVPFFVAQVCLMLSLQPDLCCACVCLCLCSEQQ